MNKKSVFIYLPTARESVRVIKYYLADHGVSYLPIITNLLNEFENKVGIFPKGSPICPELLELGVTKYLECNIGGNYRVLYSLEKEKNKTTIYVHAIISQRQSITKLLFNRLIM